MKTTDIVLHKIHNIKNDILNIDLFVRVLNKILLTWDHYRVYLYYLDWNSIYNLLYMPERQSRSELVPNYPRYFTACIIGV